MNRLISISILTSLLVCQFAKLIVVINFELNKISISKTKCVQRFKKNNTCKGSCHLKKQLKKTEDSESKGVTQVKSEFEGLLANTNKQFTVNSHNLVYSNEFVTNSFVLTNKYNSLLERPPAFV